MDHKNGGIILEKYIIFDFFEHVFNRTLRNRGIIDFSKETLKKCQEWKEKKQQNFFFLPNISKTKTVVFKLFRELKDTY